MSGSTMLASVFTAAHQAHDKIARPFRSLLDQTHDRWEWIVVDDSSDERTWRELEALVRAAPDGRVRIKRSTTTPGNIGAKKAEACALARGDILVELDHDDELLPEALEQLVEAFSGDAAVDCIYSDWIDVRGGKEAVARYGLEAAFNFVGYASEVLAGVRVPVVLAPHITWETVRHIVAMPNHVRAWRASFYRALGGHDASIPIGDDYELLVRTFLGGRFGHIPRPLYVQHYSDDGGSASQARNAEIQSRVADAYDRNEAALDARCMELGLRKHPAGPDPLLDRLPIRHADVTIDPKAPLGLVSVVIPTYDRPFLLARAIETALSQTYEHIEVLVIGDGCPEVDAVIAAFGETAVRHWNIGGPHIDGGAAARNYALKGVARGDLVAYLDDDNWWEPHHVELLVDLMEKSHATFGFASLDLGGEVVACRRPRRYQIDTSALIHRRSVLERFGYWSPRHEVGYAHDWELVSRFADEPWIASLCATTHFSLDGSPNQSALDAIRTTADEETRAALEALA